MAKHTRKQKAYKRPAAHENSLKEVTALSHPELLKRIVIKGHNSPGYIATEVLITIFRQATAHGGLPVPPIWDVLNKRLIQFARSYLKKNSGAFQASVTEDQAVELAGKFSVAMVEGFKDVVSFAECNFGMFATRIGVSQTRKDAASKRSEQRLFGDLESPSLEDDDEEPGLSDPADVLAFLYKDNPAENPLISPNSDDAYIKVLNANIRKLMRERLTIEEATAIVCAYLMDMPIEADEGKELSVSEFMGKSSRMVRNYIACGLAKLRKE